MNKRIETNMVATRNMIMTTMQGHKGIVQARMVLLQATVFRDINNAKGKEYISNHALFMFDFTSHLCLHRSVHNRQAIHRCDPICYLLM